MKSDTSTTSSDTNTDMTTDTTAGTTTGTTTGTTRDTDSDDGLMDKLASGKMAAALILAGIALFIFPEPATSMVGIALIVLGIASWAAGRYM